MDFVILLQIILCNRLDGITQDMFVGVVAPLQISLLSLLATSFYHKGGNHCKLVQLIKRLRESLSVWFWGLIIVVFL